MRFPPAFICAFIPLLLCFVIVVFNLKPVSSFSSCSPLPPYLSALTYPWLLLPSFSHLEILPLSSSLSFFFFLLIFPHSRSGRLLRYHGQLLLEPRKELPCHLLATLGSAHRTWMKIIVLLMTQDRKHPQAHTYVSKTGTAEQQGACNLKSQLR